MFRCVTVSQKIHYNAAVKILQVHNFYKIPGGEDRVVENEKNLLINNGHQVIQYIRYNDEIKTVLDKILSAIFLKKSIKTVKEFSKILDENNPDIVHVHNFFPLITPVVFEICTMRNIPVVFTLHNYRIICPTSFLMWKGKITEKSIKDGPWWSVKKRVYKNSYIGTIALSYLIYSNRKNNFWNKNISTFISLTNFSKNKFIEFGINESKIFTKPNFVVDPFPEINELDRNSNCVLYVGRLSEEKGVMNLIQAWKSVRADLVLKIAGDGPLRYLVENHGTKNIHYLGNQSNDQIKNLMRNCAFMVIPSEWYEGFPMVCVEAFSCGLPILASNIGSLKEIVSDSSGGALFEPGNPGELASLINSYYESGAFYKDSAKVRSYYLRKFTPEKNIIYLMDIYHKLKDR